MKQILCVLLLVLTACDSLGGSSAGKKTTIGPKAFDMFMKRITVVEGNIPYEGSWGPVNNAYITAISYSKSVFPSQVRFVKPGHTTQECDDPAALVLMSPGQKSTTQQLAALLGTSRRVNAVKLVACLALGGSPKPTRGFYVKLHYVKE